MAAVAAAPQPAPPPPPPPSSGRAVLFPAADDPICEAAFDFALDHVLQPGDSLVLLHVAVAEPVASGGGGGADGAKQDDAAAATDADAPPSSLAARAYSDALPAADYFYAPARPAASLEAVQAALDRRFLRKLADVSEGQLQGQPRLVVVKAAADAATVARLVLEHCERERADLLVLTGRPGREEGEGGSLVGSPRAERKNKGGFWGRLFGGVGGRRRREGGGGSDLPTTASSRAARDEEQVASAPVGAAGRHILRKAKCGVVVLRPVVLPDDAAAAAAAEGGRGDVEAAAEGEEEEEEEDEAVEEEAEAERLPDTFEAVEYAALAG